MSRRQKTAFGEYLVEQIRKADMSQEEFYKAVGIRKPYFYDLLTASPPPSDLQNRMLSVFDEKTGVNDERRYKFYDLAAEGRGEIPADIAKLITDNPEKLYEIRQELKKLLSKQGYHLLKKN